MTVRRNFERNLPDASRTCRHNFWNLIKFNEHESEDGSFAWLMSKYQCMHCVDPGCLEACPAPGAIVQHANGIVDFNPDNCIGCGYCITGCPFDVPKLIPTTKKVYKCTLCSDRTCGRSGAGVHQGMSRRIASRFGTRDDLLRLADARAEALRADGQAERRRLQSGRRRRDARALRPRGRHSARGLRPSSGSHDSLAGALWKGPLKWIGNAVLVGGVLGAILHYLRYGPKEVEE